MLFDLKKDNLQEIVKNSEYEDLEVLATEIRKFLLDKVSKTGGHLASNLGVVELSIALHRVFNTGEDRLIWDVGHQAYVHKILTGRAEAFDTLRTYKGLSGFPKSRESIHDAYDTGHSSTSLSAALGIATARDLLGENYDVIAVIGDGSMTGGIAYEALNNIGALNKNIKIILNDNGMSIARNVGAISKHLNELRLSKNYRETKANVKSTLSHIPFIGKSLSGSISRTKDRVKYSVIDNEGILFEELGIKYIGPVDGNNIKAVTEALEISKSIIGPTLVHVITTKGKGYEYSEKYPRKFHGVSPFNLDDGNLLSSTTNPSFSQVFGETMVEIADRDKSVVAITAAMGTAIGLLPYYDKYPDRFFDVGIAESHAVTFAAGLAKAGIKPVVAIYSSFLQRAYDYIIEDVCLQNLHVVFAIDRAGLVGADGETHHGQFDLSYLATMPNMKVYAPANGKQLKEILEYAIDAEGPIAIRYPRGGSNSKYGDLPKFENRNIELSRGNDVTILAVGAMLDEAMEAAEALRFKGLDVGLWNINTIKPYEFDSDSIHSKLVITIEDNIFNGGYGEMFASQNTASHFDIINFAIPDEFIEQGSIDQLREECGINSSAMVKGVLEYFERKA